MIVLSMGSCNNTSTDITSSTIGSEENEGFSASKTTKETTKTSQSTKVTETTETTKATETTETTSEKMVWIPNSGTKYHSKPSCSNMKNPSQIALSKVKQLGYEPCSRCH